MAEIKKKLKQAVKMATPYRAAAKAVKVAKAVGAGVADYNTKNKSAHTRALNMVGAEQKERIQNVGRPGSPTPYGTNTFYGKATEKANEIKKSEGISLRSSVRSKLGL